MIERWSDSHETTRIQSTGINEHLLKDVQGVLHSIEARNSKGSFFYFFNPTENRRSVATGEFGFGNLIDHTKWTYVIDLEEYQEKKELCLCVYKLSPLRRYKSDKQT